MEKIKKLRNLLKKYNLDGYIIPKNNEFFGEYVQSNEDNLKYISNFTGSAGFAIILKKKNYIFVDGRYTIQAGIQCGNNFEVCTIPQVMPNQVLKNLKIKIGFDPKKHTEISLKRYFSSFYKNLIPMNENLIDLIWKRKKITSNKQFYSLDKKVVGESEKNKIYKVKKIIKSNNIDYLFTTSSENIAWLLNIRGQDTDYSPIPNSHAIIGSNNKVKVFCALKKINNNLKDKLRSNVEFCEFNLLPKHISSIANKKILIDSNTCSFFYKFLFEKDNIVINKQDPITYLKSLKNKIEIQNSIKSHVLDGSALTKFIFWLKENVNQKQISEISAQEKLLKFRKENKDFKFLSFPTISGAGPNSAIIHYKANKKSNRALNKGDVYLVDSGGQYSYGTTDVTRTISLDVKNPKIKDIYTRVLKGHIAVAQHKLNHRVNGDIIDKAARKYLKQINLDYPHGTGHGVGYFLNVHEGPQAISKGNKIQFQEGMITSNEPGYYKKNEFGIRIENLVYVKKENKKLKFKDLTLVPIDKDLVNKKMLNEKEKRWLNSYHQNVYYNLKKYMNKKQLTQLKEACSNI